MWGQDQKEEIKKIEKFQEKAIRIINFVPLNAPVEKQMYEMNILKLKCFILPQNVLFVKVCLSENAPGSFNDNFHPSKLPLNYTARSSSTYQLKVNNFKTERFGCKSVVSKCHKLLVYKEEAHYNCSNFIAFVENRTPCFFERAC